jgi:hypothetical protein
MIRKIELLFYELHRIFPRFKLWRICKVLGIKPYKWQRDFALDRGPLVYPKGRATGKTTAVMLRLLMFYPFYGPFAPLAVLEDDPDFTTENRLRLIWYEREYNRLARECYKARIPVNTTIRLNHLFHR